MSVPAPALRPVDKLKRALGTESVQSQFRNALRENADLFVASIIDIYASDSNLQRCDPNAVIMECLKAATLRLPINRSLGFAWIVPYANVPQFQMGYKGYIQLAMRAGQYRHLNADVVYEGELKGVDKLTGSLDLSGQATSDRIVGYFAFMETLNGFRKALYWTREQVEQHAKRYSKAYSRKDSAWQTSFDAMALKTVVRNLLAKYGVLSIEMARAFDTDTDEDEAVARQVGAQANAEVMDLECVDGKGEGAEAATTTEPAQTAAGPAESLQPDGNGKAKSRQAALGTPKPAF